MHPVRSAYSESGRVENAYLKLDIEHRALKKWGSWTALEEELRRKRRDVEEVEKRRRGEWEGYWRGSGKSGWGSGRSRRG